MDYSTAIRHATRFALKNKCTMLIISAPDEHENHLDGVHYASEKAYQALFAGKTIIGEVTPDGIYLPREGK